MKKKKAGKRKAVKRISKAGKQPRRPSGKGKESKVKKLIRLAKGRAKTKTRKRRR